MSNKYTEGICQDGAAILEDGKIITIDRILELLNSNVWISVDNRLPEKTDQFLVFVESDGYHGEYMCVELYSPKYGWCEADSPNYITHWQPLPEGSE